MVISFQILMVFLHPYLCLFQLLGPLLIIYHCPSVPYYLVSTVSFTTTTMPSGSTFSLLLCLLPTAGQLGLSCAKTQSSISNILQDEIIIIIHIIINCLITRSVLSLKLEHFICKVSNRTHTTKTHSWRQLLILRQRKTEEGKHMSSMKRNFFNIICHIHTMHLTLLEINIE